MRSRLITVVVSLLAASAFALAVQTAWWSVGEVTIGPFGARHCFGGECRESGLAWIGGSELWMRSGVAVRAGGFIAMFGLILLAAGVAAKRVPKLAAKFSLASIVTAAATGGYFAFAFPGIADAGIARGVFIFIVANVLGTAAAITVLRADSPHEQR